MNAMQILWKVLMLCLTQRKESVNALFNKYNNVVQTFLRQNLVLDIFAWQPQNYSF
jgi:hypothetical protein